MNVIQRLDECRHAVAELKANGKRVGFVPTMGALHEGHLELVKASLEECDATVVSIFVNPTQFNDGEDFKNYPVDMDGDLKKLESLGGVDIIFNPSADDMYPKGSMVTVSPGPMGDLLEGMTRQGHFRGVLTVVMKLFSMVQPDTSYFGAKDFQQFSLISKMVIDLNLPIELRMVETVREDDGLAMSSRNLRLSEADREEAPILFQALEMGKKDIVAGTPPMEAISKMMSLIIENSRCEVDYLAVVNPYTLEDLEEVGERDSYVIAVAAYLGPIRLIDNIMHLVKL